MKYRLLVKAFSVGVDGGVALLELTFDTKKEAEVAFTSIEVTNFLKSIRLYEV